MSKALFNTLELAKDLEAAGVQQKQAEAIADNLNKVLEGTLAPVINEREEDKRELTRLSNEIKQGFATTNENIAKLETRLIKYILASLVAFAGFVFTAAKFIH